MGHLASAFPGGLEIEFNCRKRQEGRQQATAQSLLQLPFYHPVVEEMLQTALKEIAQNFPDDLPSGLARA